MEADQPLKKAKTESQDRERCGLTFDPSVFYVYSTVPSKIPKPSRVPYWLSDPRYLNGGTPAPIQQEPEEKMEQYYESPIEASEPSSVSEELVPVVEATPIMAEVVDIFPTPSPSTYKIQSNF